jgi:hypothetical protein
MLQNKQEIIEIINRLQLWVADIAVENGYENNHAYEYGYFISAISTVLDNTLSDKHIMLLRNNVNDYIK